MNIKSAALKSGCFRAHSSFVTGEEWYPVNLSCTSSVLSTLVEW